MYYIDYCIYTYLFIYIYNYNTRIYILYIYKLLYIYINIIYTCIYIYIYIYLYRTKFEKSWLPCTHNKTHFTPSNNSCTHWLTIQPDICTESCPGCFCYGLSDVHKCFGPLQMAAYPLGKQTAGCNSTNNWLMSLAIDLTALCNMWGWKWHHWMPFGWF